MTNVNQLVDETYTLWLNHARHLYQFCTTHVLEWPTMTVAWLSDSRREMPMRDYSVSQIAFGTCSPETNFVQIYHVFVECERDEDEMYTEEEMAAFDGYGGTFSEVSALMQRHCRFVHDGPVSMIRPMPSRPHLMAVRGRKKEISIVDIARRRAEPEDRLPRPDMVLKGHLREGRGMEWCECTEGLMATASADNTVNIWDVNGELEECGKRGTVALSAVQELKGHMDVVDDVAWHPSHQNVIVSVSWDKTIRVWDTRSKKAQHDEVIHRAEVHGVEFHPTAAFVVATASSDNSVRIWDIRNWKEPQVELIGHTDAVHGVHWAPFNDTVLLSYGVDRTVNCWDIGKANSPLIEGDDDHAGPELVFKHSGHTATIREAAWAPFEEDEWTVASVDDNNILQLWSPHNEIYNDELDIEQYNQDVV